MSEKKQLRKRRGLKARHKIRELGENRLTVNRTPRHIYAQIIAPCGGQILASASTVEKDFRDNATGNAGSAAKIGELIAERAKIVGVTRVAFDRSGYKYHGRVKALAEAAREGGLEF